MKVSNIIFRSFDSEGDVKAWVSVTVNDCIAIHEIKITQTEQKLSLVMPNIVNKKGERRDAVHPIDSEARKTLEDAILTAYHSCRCGKDLDL